MEGSLVGYSPWGCKELDTTERPGTTHREGKIFLEVGVGGVFTVFYIKQSETNAMCRDSLQNTFGKNKKRKK